MSMYYFLPVAGQQRSSMYHLWRLRLRRYMFIVGNIFQDSHMAAFYPLNNKTKTRRYFFKTARFFYLFNWIFCGDFFFLLSVSILSVSLETLLSHKRTDRCWVPTEFGADRPIVGWCFLDEWNGVLRLVGNGCAVIGHLVPRPMLTRRNVG